MRPTVAVASQPERLRGALAGAQVGHGDAVRADLRGLRVEAVPRGTNPVLRFCFMDPIVIRTRLTQGDGRPAHGEVEVHGLEVPKEGRYDVRNALISTNGRITVEVDARSEVEFRGAIPTIAAT